MSPVSGKTDETAAVYVLNRHVQGRPVVRTPTTNAERPDTDFFYAEGVYDAYPVRKALLEARRASEARKTARVQDWAITALDTLDAGGTMPPTKRAVLAEVLLLIYQIGPSGITRPEICRMLHRDGGKVSGAMTDLHAARIIYPLEGIRR